MEPSRKKMRLTLSSDSTKPAVQPLLKLPKIPLLVQGIMIQMMTPHEQYLLSKCSKRASQMVKTSMPKKNNREIWVKFDQQLLVSKWEDIVKFYLKIAENIDLIHTAPGKFSPEDHRYICNLFRAPLDVYVNWTGFKFFGNYLESPPFPTIGEIKRSNLLEYEGSDSSLKEFSKQYPCHDVVLLNGRCVKSLGPDHTFLRAESLMLSSIEGVSPFRVLISFKGKHLLMEKVIVCKSSIVIFVDYWMKNSNNNLKSVIFKLSSRAVIGNLKYEKFGGSRKYRYDSPIKDYHKFPTEIFDCSEGYEIRRETDGKVAFIKITKDFFCFWFGSC